MAYRL